MIRWIENFADGWGTYPKNYERKYRSIDGSIAFNGGRADGNAFRGGNIDEHVYTKELNNVSPEQSVWGVGFGMKIEKNGGTGFDYTYRTACLTFFTGTEGSPVQTQVSLMVERVDTQTYKWELRRGDQQDDPLIEETGTFPADEWIYWEIIINIDPSNGYFDIYKDGNIFHVGGTLLDTAATGVAGADSMGFTLSTANKWTTSGFETIDICDWYILDDTGTGPGNFLLGPVQTERIFPDADDKAYDDWTPSTGVNHYALVNETAWSAGTDDEHVYADSAPLIDLWFYEDSSLAFGSNIVAIQINTTAAMRTSGSRKFKHKFNDNISTPANLANGNEEFFINDVLWDVYSEVFEDDPVAGGTFTKTKIEDYSFGIIMTE